MDLSWKHSGWEGIREDQEHSVLIKLRKYLSFSHPNTGLFVYTEHFACPENPAGRQQGGYGAASAAAGFQPAPAEKPGSPGVGATQPPQALSTGTGVTDSCYLRTQEGMPQHSEVLLY